MDALHALINLRNALMHVNELAAVHETEMPWPLDTHAINLPPPVLDTQWFSVRLATAQTYHEVVELYVQEILFPASGEITPGRLVWERADAGR